MPKITLIDDDTDEFHPKCKAALEEIFHRFDIDQDGALNDRELDQFALACNGNPFSESDRQQIKEFFDINQQESLTEKGFLEMYHTQTSAEPKETWRDLRKLGYNNNLELATTNKNNNNDNNNENNNNDPNKKIEKEQSGKTPSSEEPEKQ